VSKCKQRKRSQNSSWMSNLFQTRGAGVKTVRDGKSSGVRGATFSFGDLTNTRHLQQRNTGAHGSQNNSGQRYEQGQNRDVQTSGTPGPGNYNVMTEIAPTFVGWNRLNLPPQSFTGAGVSQESGRARGSQGRESPTGTFLPDGTFVPLQMPQNQTDNTIGNQSNKQTDSPASVSYGESSPDSKASPRSDDHTGPHSQVNAVYSQSPWGQSKTVEEIVIKEPSDSRNAAPHTRISWSKKLLASSFRAPEGNSATHSTTLRKIRICSSEAASEKAAAAEIQTRKVKICG